MLEAATNIVKDVNITYVSTDEDFVKFIHKNALIFEEFMKAFETLKLSTEDLVKAFDKLAKFGKVGYCFIVPTFTSNLALLLPGVTQKVKHPITGYKKCIADIIVNLNDAHRWTREQIADWLETLDIDMRFK